MDLVLYWILISSIVAWDRPFGDGLCQLDEELLPAALQAQVRAAGAGEKGQQPPVPRHAAGAGRIPARRQRRRPAQAAHLRPQEALHHGPNARPQPGAVSRYLSSPSSISRFPISGSRPRRGSFRRSEVTLFCC